MPSKALLATAFDVGAYLRRIKLEPPMPDDLLDKNRLALLQRIMLAHSRSIPFENIDIVLGR
jgi:N-hydroxyarylamine O-acetyltransferase